MLIAVTTEVPNGVMANNTTENDDVAETYIESMTSLDRAETPANETARTTVANFSAPSNFTLTTAAAESNNKTVTHVSYLITTVTPITTSPAEAVEAAATTTAAGSEHTTFKPSSEMFEPLEHTGDKLVTSSGK